MATIVLPMPLNLGGNDATNVGGPMQAVDSLNPVCCRLPPPTHTPRRFILLVCSRRISSEAPD